MGENDFDFYGVPFYFFDKRNQGYPNPIITLSNIASVEPSETVEVNVDIPYRISGSGTIAFEDNTSKIVKLYIKLAFTKDRRARKSLKRKIKKLKP